MDYRKNFMFLFLFVMMFSFAAADLGTAKTGECFNLKVTANCSSVNLTEVGIGDTMFTLNSPMQKIGGQTWNYTFCNNNVSGIYSFSWNNPCIDCSQGNCGNSYWVTPNGQRLDISISILFGFIFFIIVGFLWLAIYGLNNAAKAEWQIAYICGTYLSLFCLFFVAWLFSSYYLWQTPVLASIFWILWFILSLLFFPFIIFVGSYLLKKQAEAFMEKELTSQGYSPEDSQSMARNR